MVLVFLYMSLVSPGESLANVSEVFLYKQYELNQITHGLASGEIPQDPTRDQSVNAILWEIHRESAVELTGKGFRFDHLRRWRNKDYAIATKLGRYMTKGIEYTHPSEK